MALYEINFNGTFSGKKGLHARSVELRLCELFRTTFAELFLTEDDDTGLKIHIAGATVRAKIPRKKGK